MATYQVADKGDLRKYRTEIPNSVDDMDLSVYAFRLYVHLKRVAGDSGTCWQSTDTLAKACKMSAGMVSRAKEELKAMGLIAIETQKNERGGRDYHHISMVDIWLDNLLRFTNSPDELASSPHELASSYSEQASSPHELKKEPLVKKEPNKKELNTPPAKKAMEGAALFGIAKTLAEVTGMDFEKNKGRLFREAKNYRPEDAPTIARDYGEGGPWYRCDWRGKRGDRPTLPQIRETWGNLGVNGNGSAKRLTPTERAAAAFGVSLGGQNGK